MAAFEIKEAFYLDGKKFKIISGAVHYFRIRPEYWLDRLEKLRNSGCNTVETYIPWNFHEPKKGEFLWDGDRDFTQFIRLAQSLGLYVIIRPSPYICAEWEFGGLPAWLIPIKGMKLRSSAKPYLDNVRDYYNQLIPRLVPCQIDRGGPVILVQVENEYGYFGRNKAYLRFLAGLMRELGITVPLVTSDGPWGPALNRGSIKEALPTANFGSNALMQFAALKRKGRKNAPLMCMEFWAGWFDAWGNKEHKTSNLEQNKKDLIYMLENGNVNFYMFHGGTNFGFMNGSNYYGKATPDVTSYDYDALLTEDGQITKKYQELGKIIQKYNPVAPAPASTKIQRKAYGKLTPVAKTGLFDSLPSLAQPKTSQQPLSMEDAGQSTGYILYKTRLLDGQTARKIKIEEGNDRLSAFSAGTRLFTLWDKEITRPQTVSFSGDLAILVENLGRVNFSKRLNCQQKGITGNVRINGRIHLGWEAYTLPFDEEQLSRLDFSAPYTPGLPAFYKFEFEAELPAGEYTDTFLDFSGWGKGFAVVNGFNIGRFWELGPQKRLYIPGPLLKNGRNQIILFETEGRTADYIELCDSPCLG